MERYERGETTEVDPYSSRVTNIERRGEIADALARLEDLRKGLQEATSRLEQRIQPILRQQHPSEEKSETIPETEAALAGQLNTHARQLTLVVDHIADMCRRVEL